MTQSIPEYLEDYALKPVPAERRRSWVDLAMVWIGAAIVVSALLRGMMIGMGLGALPAVLLAYVLGEVLLIGIMVLIGYLGARTGLTTALLARGAFGPGGSLLISACLALTFMGWFGVQAGLFAEAVISYTGWPLPIAAVTFVSGLVLMIPAVFGFRGLKLLSYAAVPLMLVIFIYAAVRLGGRMLPSAELTALARAHIPEPYPMTIGAAASIVAGGFVVGAVASADVFRYARPRLREIFYAATLSMGVSAGMQAVGSILAMGTGQYHERLPDIIIHPEFAGLGLFGFLAIGFAQWTNIDLNLYSSVLAFNTLIRWTRWKLAVVVGVVSSLLGALGILSRLGLFLSLLGISVGPIGGIICTHHYLLRRRRDLRSIGGWNPVAIAAYLASVAIGWITAGHPLTIPVFPFSIFAFNGILASVVLYAVGMRIWGMEDRCRS